MFLVIFFLQIISFVHTH